MWEYRARLIEVIDGDTVKLLIDTGFNGRQEESIRLSGVSAPEKNQPGGPETKSYINLWVYSHANPDLTWPLYVRTSPNKNPEPSEIRTFTRYVGWVQLFGTQRWLNDVINDYLAEHPEWGTGL